MAASTSSQGMVLISLMDEIWLMLTYLLRWHCDLKPDNILRVDGEFKLADFGFAKFKPKYPHGAPPEKLITLITGGTETYG